MKKALYTLAFLLAGFSAFSQTKIRISQIEDIQGTYIKSLGEAANKVLTTNGTGGATWQIPATWQAPLSGTGFVKITGTTIRYDAASYANLVLANTFTQSQTINSSSTTAKITINAGTSVPSMGGGMMDFNRAATTLLRIGTEGAIFSGSSGTGGVLAAPSSNSLILATGDTRRLTLNRYGRILVNTSSDDGTSILQVNGITSASGFNLGANDINDAGTLTNVAYKGILTNAFVPYYKSSNTSLQNTDIYYDGTNIGIGTIYPYAKLQVQSVSSLPATTGTTVTSQLRLSYQGGTIVGDIGLNPFTPYGMWMQATRNNDFSVHDPILIQPNGGNVGIGTIAPLHKLDFAMGNSLTQQDYINFAPYNGGGGYGSGITWKANYTGHTRRSAGILQIAENTSFRSGIAFFTNSDPSPTVDWTEKMRITGDGKVGIGTTTPGAELDINGSVRANSTATGPGYQDLASTLYVQARGENLLTNGTALMGSNYNFPNFTFVGNESYYSGGAFKFVGSGTPYTNEYMPVDPNLKYKLKFHAKSELNEGRYYAFCATFDADKLGISAQHHMYRANTLTALAQPLNNGDNTVYLTNAANWDNTGTAGVSTHLRSVILWNYTNSFGYTYPALTYSRNWTGDAWNPGSINFTNNTITLRVPWTGGSVPAGTQLSNGSSGGSFKYIPALVGTLIPTTWTEIVGIMEGVDLTGTNVGGKFTPGTAFAKIGWLMDYQATPPADTAYFANLTFGSDTYLPLSGGTVTGNLTVTGLTTSVSGFKGATTNNLNTLGSEVGVFKIETAAAAATNLPITAPDNANGVLTLNTSGTNYAKQIAWVNNDDMYIRRITNGSYSLWYKLYHSGNANLGTVAWNASQYSINGANINTAGTLTNVAYKGTLTTNYIPKYGTNQLENSQIFDNGTNVGVGTTNPPSKLGVSVSSPVNISPVVTSTVHVMNNLASGVKEALHLDGYTNTFDKGLAISIGYKAVISDATSRIIGYGNVSNNYATRLQLQTHASSASVWNNGIMIDELGNVGIGTTAPGEKLEVAGKTKTTTFQMTTTPSAGHVMTSDASGNGTWTALNIPTNTNQLTNGSGYITDGNSGWDNSYGFITSGGDNISIEGVAVADPNLIGSNIISIANTTGSTYQFNLNSGTVAENHLDVSNSPTNAYALKWNSSLSKLEWQADNTGSGMVYPGAGIALSGGSSWSGSIANNSGSWNTAYTERATWDGGTSGLVAATARISIDLTPTTISGQTTNSATAGYHTHQLSFYGSGSGPSFLGYDASYGIAWKTAGSSGQVVYNNGTVLTGSSALTSNGTNITSTGTFTGTNFILSSDRRLKKNIQPIGDMSWVDDIHFKSFYMNNDLTATMRYGVIAQELETVNPGLVSTGDNGYKAVSYIDLLIAKVARQDEILNKLIKQIEKLEKHEN